MATALEETKSTLPAVTYDISAERLAELEAECKELDPAKSTKAYEESRIVLRKLVTTRTTMDKRRKELKADSLAWGRLVDSEYKKWETLLLAIEEPVAAKIKAVDEAKEHARRAKEEAERKALEAELEAKRAAEAAAIKAEQDRIAEANRIEAERLAKIAAEQAAKQREIDEAKAEVEAEKQRQAAAAAELEAKRIEAEKPVAPPTPVVEVAGPPPARGTKKVLAKDCDTAVINSLVFTLGSVVLPQVSTDKALFFVAQLRTDLGEIVERCREFKA
jgi:hypothetical protein